MSAVLHRKRVAELPTAVRADGVWIEDASGRRYLDAASGALVVNVGHGDRAVIDAVHRQMSALSYVHPTAFTTDVLERYASRLAAVVPVARARVYPVSGGSEAVETAIKLARAYHLARGDRHRHRIVSRDGSYHGNTRGALDVSSRRVLRQPYEPWLGLTAHVPAVNEYRCPSPGHPAACADWHLDALEQELQGLGPQTVAAFIAEPIGGATLGATRPPDGYWAGLRALCDRHGILLVADEVMTGFGRTGRWFALDHDQVEVDIVTAGKGASSGYWPLGLTIASGDVADTVGDGGFVHGFTFSHHPVGAAAGLAVLQRMEEADLVGAADRRGEQLRRRLTEELAHSAIVGDIRGAGLMVALEVVRNRDTKTPFPRELLVTEWLVRVLKEQGVLVYSSVGCADGATGDMLLLGPPLIISDDEVELLVDRVSAGVSAAQDHFWGGGR